MSIYPNKANSRFSAMRQGPLFGGSGKGGNPPPIPPTPPIGPLDVVGRVDGYFTNFSQEFTLEADCAVVGLCCAFTGDPVVTVKHGEDTLTILRQERSGNLLSLLAYGTGLVVETADVSITATGGQLNGGAMRISEVYHTSAQGSVGWIDGVAGTGAAITPAIMENQINGLVKGALVAGAADRYHTMNVNGASIVWNGFTSSGIPIATDTTTSGPWVLGAGWTIDGDDFVHTGAESVLSISYPAITGINSARMEADIETGTVLVGPTTTTYDRYATGQHYICTAHGFSTSQIRITANGDCRISNVTIVSDAKLVSWLFCTTPAEAGEDITFTQPYRPDWAYSLAEVACPDTPDGAWRSFVLTAGDTGVVGLGYTAPSSSWGAHGEISRQPNELHALINLVETNKTQIAFSGDVVELFGDGYTISINGTILAVDTPPYLIVNGSLLETRIAFSDYDFVVGQTYTIERVPIPMGVLDNGEWNDEGVWFDNRGWED